MSRGRPHGAMARPPSRNEVLRWRRDWIHTSEGCSDVAKVENALREVKELNRNVRPADAQARMARLLTRELSAAELVDNYQAIVVALDGFFPKRKKPLMELLNARIAQGDGQAVGRLPGTQITEPELEDFADALRQSLVTLSDRHIFQWSTYYRDVVDRTLHDACGLHVRASKTVDIEGIVRAEFKSHAGEIFAKGYEYASSSAPGDPITPVEKARKGLRAFLDLPVESYSATLRTRQSAADARALRFVCSAMLTGVLSGFASTKFGSHSGSQVLVDSFSGWCQQLPLLTKEDLDSVLLVMQGARRGAIAQNISPLLEAVDAQLREADAIPMLPAFASYDISRDRLDVTLRVLAEAQVAPFMNVHCYLDAKWATIPQLSQGQLRGVVLFLAPLEAAVSQELELDTSVQPILVDTNVHAQASIGPAVIRVREILRRNLEKVLGQAVKNAPLELNVAKGFPLNNPTLVRYFFVNRPSVQRLLQGYETQNGVHLWCSVRRSGKTTACFDLAAPDDSLLVMQTCNRSQQHPQSTVLWDAVEKHVESGERLGSSFIADLAIQCSAGEAEQAHHGIMLIDEYESIFERLRLGMRRNAELRYTITQPLLDQLVDFSRDNLLILVGQRPDAHFIIMDQNALSPYVEQDQFPLFDHVGNGGHSEFSLLLDKVLSGSIEYESSWADAVFGETAGHPFLTVNLLVSFIDWLIVKKYSTSSGPLTADQFTEFASSELQPRRIRENREFEFFHQVASAAVSEEGARNTPWLHCVYLLLQTFALEAPKTLSLSTAQAEQALDRAGIEGRFGLNPGSLMRNAALANFLDTSTEGTVRPRIPLVSRIAATASPGVVP